jgi:hypothetical protein
VGELDDLLEAFTCYLRRERSPAATTVENYLNQARPFATWYSQRHRPGLAGLTVRDVNEFLVAVRSLFTRLADSGGDRVAGVAAVDVPRWTAGPAAGRGHRAGAVFRGGRGAESSARGRHESPPHGGQIEMMAQTTCNEAIIMSPANASCNWQALTWW